MERNRFEPNNIKPYDQYVSISTRKKYYVIVTISYIKEYTRICDYCLHHRGKQKAN